MKTIVCIIALGALGSALLFGPSIPSVTDLPNEAVGNPRLSGTIGQEGRVIPYDQLPGGHATDQASEGGAQKMVTAGRVAPGVLPGENSDAIADSHGQVVLKPLLSGDDIAFAMQLETSTHHQVAGVARSAIGAVRYQTELLPSNEVELKLRLKQDGLKEIEMAAYFDLANISMELDGGNNVLNKQHKELMRVSADHLRMQFMQQYEGLEVPEHAFMLVQILSYWSRAPEGFVYERRQM